MFADESTYPFRRARIARMAYDEDLADRVRQILSPSRKLREQKMFGGIGFMVDDKMVAGVHGPDLIVRVPAEEHDAAAKEQGAGPMTMGGRTSKGFLFIDPTGTKSAASLKKWVKRSEAFVATLPAKKKPKRR
jgi:TfoX/Sxy family transcriptional regulator of competence genes